MSCKSELASCASSRPVKHPHCIHHNEHRPTCQIINFATADDTVTLYYYMQTLVQPCITLQHEPASQELPVPLLAKLAQRLHFLQMQAVTCQSMLVTVHFPCLLSIDSLLNFFWSTF